MPDEPTPAERYAAARRRSGAPRLAEFAGLLGFPLDDFQVTACQALEAGRGVLVAAPTGAGKTVVGEFAVHLGLAAGRKAFYTTPIKALSNQKHADLVRRYGAGQVGLLTGDTTLNGEAPVVVMTTEVLRNMLYAGSDLLDGLGYVVMDEVHYLADRTRGAVWEEVIIHLPESVALVSLSATVSNAEEFGDWLSTVRGDTAVVVCEHRPVPLGQHVLVGDRLLDLYARHVDPTAPGVDPPINPELIATLRRLDGPGGPRNRGRVRGPGRADRAGRLRVTPTFAMVDLLERAHMLPAIVFVFSRAGCQAAVDRCVAAGVRLTGTEERARIDAVVAERLAVVDPADLAALDVDGFAEALGRGVAAHHAGLLPLFKETVEELFAAGLVKVVFATETLALGINMPARAVVLDQLVKWDGRAMTDLTPGEYTQLTGRAGRRGIDTEGHAVVLGRPGLDPVHLAGLASRRLYPLRSSFAPSYNMAVNLVAQVGRERAREVLETSFAQYQADRAVVAQARQLQATARALEEATTAMQCHLGDVLAYDELRRELSVAEQGGVAGDRAQALCSLTGLAPGDVVLVPAGRRPDHAVVVATEPALDGPRPTVLGTDARTRVLTAADLGPGVTRVGRLGLPAGFDVRAGAARRDLAARLRRQVEQEPHGARPRAVRDPTAGRRVADLRRRLRAHPCHACPDRDRHLRQGVRRSRLLADQARLTAAVAGRAGTVAARFDTVCDVLVQLGYLTVAGDDLRPTEAGRGLRRIYTENDLLAAQCLRGGVLDDLDPAQLAGVVCALVYRSRRDEHAEPRVPGGPDGRVASALHELAVAWRTVSGLEAAAGLPTTPEPDLGLVDAVHRWALGRSLPVVLRSAGLDAGDFVRWVKQVIDLLGQLGQAAARPTTRDAAARAVTALRRGVVAYGTG